MLQRYSTIAVARAMISLGLLLALPVWAETQDDTASTQQTPAAVTKAFELSQVNADQFVKIVGTIAGQDVSMTAVEDRPFLMVVGPKRKVDAIGELIASGLLGSQNVQTTEFVRVEHADLPELFTALIDITGSAGLAFIESQKAIAVTGSPDFITTTKDIIARMDIPQPGPEPKKNIELTIYLLTASEQGATAPGEAPPDGLEDVVTEMKKTFPYQDYRLWNTVFLRCRDGEDAESSGMLPGDADAAQLVGSAMFKFRARGISIEAGADPHLIRIDELTVGAEIPMLQGSSGQATRVSRHEIGLSTDVDVREGQKAVIGKANIDASGNAALFVVLTAHVVD